MPVKSVVVSRAVVDSVLTYSRAAHPREGILMLRGRSKKGVLRVESVAIPPMATHGEGFSSFNWFMVPIDLSSRRRSALPFLRAMRCPRTRTCFT